MIRIPFLNGRRLSLSLAVVSVVLGPLLLAPATQAKELGFASPYSSGMVVQRGKPIAVQGHGAQAAEVNVSLDSLTVVAKTDDQGDWQVEFAPLPAGGPHKLSVTQGEHQASLDDILVGDVWVFSGQSNMQMPLREVDGGAEVIANADSTLPVRLLLVPKSGSDKPRAELGSRWQHCTSDSLQNFSAVGWFFAQHLRQDPALNNVPLGLIDCSFGGTTVEGWTPPGLLPPVPEDKLRVSMFGMTTSHLYNGMVTPLLPYKVKGVAWYQGESNVGSPTVYAELLSNMMVCWREAWQAPELPFLIVQLPAYEGRIEAFDYSWVREAEDQACQNTPNAWVAATYDTTPGFDLHPKEKEEIGRRLALLARREVYDQDIQAHSPRVVDAIRHDSYIELKLDQPVAPPQGKKIEGCWIAGEDGEFFAAKATLDGKQLRLESKAVPAPRDARLAWGSLPTTNLYNEAGLPVLPFRTDNQPPQSLLFQPLPTSYRVETPAYSLELGRGGSITSLVVGGKQFMSNEPGGGTSIPNFFGPRNLAYISMDGPRRLNAADDAVKLAIVASERSMTWTVGHQGGEDLDFRIALSPAVEVTLDGTTALLTYGDSQLKMEGVKRLEGEHMVIANIPSRDTNTIQLTIVKP